MRATQNSNLSSEQKTTESTKTSEDIDSSALKESFSSESSPNKGNLLLRTLGSTATRALSSWENTLEEGLTRQGKAFSKVAEFSATTREKYQTPTTQLRQT